MTDAASYHAWLGTAAPADDRTHACFCIGPRNGDPVCPCMMKEHNRRKTTDLALEMILTRGRPRIRVKAGRQVVPS